MKKILIPILLFLAACNNKKQPVVVVDPPAVRDTTIHSDDFGIKEFNKTQRKVVSEEKGKRVKDPPLPPPPPAPVYSPPGVILLDFDGHTVTGTMWGTTIIATPSGMSIDEQQRIVDTVAKWYKQFNIIITTSDSVYNKAPSNKRRRCIITEYYEWFGRAGGVSFVGSFNWQTEEPCFVFSLLLNYSTKMIYVAVAHEVGHTLGLYHQGVYDANCVQIAPYNYGNANFAPIMGVAYNSATAGWIVSCKTNDTSVVKNALK